MTTTTAEQTAGPVSIDAVADLAKAQLAMTSAKRNAENPHLQKSYADLASVQAACLDALNQNNFAVVQRHVESSVVTDLMHTSGTVFTTSVPITLRKNDMQSLGSAITYGRRYGLMLLTGVAPAEDDGHGASNDATACIDAEQVAGLRKLIDDVGADLEKFLGHYNVGALEELPAMHMGGAVAALEAKRGSRLQGVASRLKKTAEPPS